MKDYVPPKAMIEFTRKMQEKRLVQGSREELNNMTPEEVDLEVFITFVARHAKNVYPRNNYYC